MLDTFPTYHRVRGARHTRGGRARRHARLLGATLMAGATLGWMAAGSASTLAASGPELVISGAGWGHGVGMSQEGALGYAEHGYSYAQILGHYYAGTVLRQGPAPA